MRMFKVPFDIKREEKIFGGYLSLRQVTYLLLATSSLSILATGLSTVTKTLLIASISVNNAGNPAEHNSSIKLTPIANTIIPNKANIIFFS